MKRETDVHILQRSDGTTVGYPFAQHDRYHRVLPRVTLCLSDLLSFYTRKSGVVLRAETLPLSHLWKKGGGLEALTQALLSFLSPGCCSDTTIGAALTPSAAGGDGGIPRVGKVHHGRRGVYPPWYTRVA